MTGWLLLAGIVIVAYLGFALLALGQARHWRRVSGAAPQTRGRTLVLRATGSSALLLALGLALLRDGPSFGALLWATAISLAAAVVAFTLAWRPAWLRPLAALLAVRSSGRRPGVVATSLKRDSR